MHLEPLDIAIIASYFVVVLIIGFHFARRHTGTEAYFLAGRRLGWMVIGFSLFASNISSTTLVGLSGSAYRTGISISNYEWMASVVLVFFAIFFIPYYLGARIYTLPEFLEKRFDGRCRYYFSVLTIVGNVFIDTAGTLFAGALVIKHFFPSLDYWESALALALVAGIYTAAGGLSAVVYTDAIQAVVILIGASAVTLLALSAVGSWEQLIEQTPPEMLSVVRPLDDPTMPWLGLLLGVPILGFYFWCTNQFIVQRVLGARSIEHARWGSLFAALLKLPVLFIMVFPGLMARQLYPGLERADLVFPQLISDLLPVGLKGLMLAGLLAAIMSSIDSTLNSASTLVTMDFVKKARPQTPDHRLAVYGRVTTLVIMVVSALWTPVVASFETLFGYLQSALAYLVPPVAAVFIIGLFWKRANSRGALAGLILGHVLSISVLILQRFGIGTEIHFLMWAGVFFAFSIVVIVGVSLGSPPPDPQLVRRFVWSRETARELTADLPDRPWYLDYRWHSAGLLLLTAWLVIAYW